MFSGFEVTLKHLLWNYLLHQVFRVYYLEASLFHLECFLFWVNQFFPHHHLQCSNDQNHNQLGVQTQALLELIPLRLTGFDFYMHYFEYLQVQPKVQIVSVTLLNCPRVMDLYFNRQLNVLRFYWTIMLTLTLFMQSLIIIVIRVEVYGMFDFQSRSYLYVCCFYKFGLVWSYLLASFQLFRLNFRFNQISLLVVTLWNY